MSIYKCFSIYAIALALSSLCVFNLPVLIVCLSYTLETSVESNCTRLNSRTIKLSETEDDNPDLEDLLFEDDPLLEESLLLLPPPLINLTLKLKKIDII